MMRPSQRKRRRVSGGECGAGDEVGGHGGEGEGVLEVRKRGVLFFGEGYMLAMEYAKEDTGSSPGENLYIFVVGRNLIPLLCLLQRSIKPIQKGLLPQESSTQSEMPNPKKNTPCKHYFHSKESVLISLDAFVHGYCTH
jgi:hypothetical protein